MSSVIFSFFTIVVGAKLPPMAQLFNGVGWVNVSGFGYIFSEKDKFRYSPRTVKLVKIYASTYGNRGGNFSHDIIGNINILFPILLHSLLIPRSSKFSAQIIISLLILRVLAFFSKLKRKLVWI